MKRLRLTMNSQKAFSRLNLPLRSRLAYRNNQFEIYRNDSLILNKLCSQREKRREHNCVPKQVIHTKNLHQHGISILTVCIFPEGENAGRKQHDISASVQLGIS